MRLLIVEDEPNLGQQLRNALEGAGYAVDLATDGEEGLYLGSNEQYDAIILDLGLPDENGLALLRRLRGYKRMEPILVLTARGEGEMRVQGLDSGADDYIVKPFLFPELHARICAVLRRQGGYVEHLLAVGTFPWTPGRAKCGWAANPPTFRSARPNCWSC